MFCRSCGEPINGGQRFCTTCGFNLHSASHSFQPLNEATCERDAITFYHEKGFSNDLILKFLSKYHHNNMSLRTLKRRLQTYSLSRFSNIDERTLKSIIERELEGPAASLGYRGMWYHLRNIYGLKIPRDIILRLLKEIDPEATERRKSRNIIRRTYLSPGPNFCWHLDGYDKLKHCGFPVYGAIDGHSRKLIFLKLVRSNNNPVVPAFFYLKAIEEEKKCPALLQTDCGSETGLMAAIHCYIWQNEDAHRYGKSTSNQRIECFWSFFKKSFTSSLIDYFKTLQHRGEYSPGNILHLECAWFAFADLLQSWLDNILNEWNLHYIRRSRYYTVPGIPNSLYYLPEDSGFQECGKTITDEDILLVEEQLGLSTEAQSVLASPYPELENYFRNVVEGQGIRYPPNNMQEAEEIFFAVKNSCI